MSWVKECQNAIAQSNLSTCEPFGKNLEFWVSLWPVFAAIIAFILLLFRKPVFNFFQKFKSHPPVVPHSIDSDLIGRDVELQGMENHFTTSNNPLVLSGGPGVGKTVLARDYANHQKLARYHDWVFLTLTSLSAIKTELEFIGSQLGVDAELGELAYILATFQKMQDSGKCWLVILDNADEEKETDLAKSCIKNFNNVDFIITSQRGTWPWSYEIYNVRTLQPGYAVKLLSDLSGRGIDNDLCNLAKLLDYLPLALTIVGKDLKNHEGSLVDYTKDFSEILDKQPDNDHYKKSVATAIRRAYDRLGEAAKALLNIAAFMDPNDISAEFFVRGAVGIKEKEYDPLPEPLWSTLQDKIKINRVLKEAETHSLLYPSTWRDEFTHRIHRTTQMVLRDMLADKTGEIAGFAARLGWAQISGNPQYDTQNWPYYHRLAPHAEALLSFAGSTEGVDGKYMTHLATDMDVFLKCATGDFNRAIRLGEGALLIVERLFGKNSSHYAASLSNLASAKDDLAHTLTSKARAAMEREAEVAYMKAIEIHSKISESEESLACIHSSLGVYYWSRERFSDAETHCKIALKLDEDNGEEAHVIAVDFGNLGALYSEWANEEADPSKIKDYREKALDFKIRALALTRIALGEIHQNSAMQTGNLSVEYDQINELDKALIFAIRATAILFLMVERGEMSSDNPKVEKYKKSLEITLSALGRGVADAPVLIDDAKPEISAQHKKWEAAKAAGEDYDPPPILPADSSA